MRRKKREETWCERTSRISRTVIETLLNDTDNIFYIPDSKVTLPERKSITAYQFGYGTQNGEHTREGARYILTYYYNKVEPNSSFIYMNVNDNGLDAENQGFYISNLTCTLPTVYISLLTDNGARLIDFFETIRTYIEEGHLA